MYLHDGDEGGVEVVRLCLLRVEDLDGVGAAGDGEDGLTGDDRGGSQSYLPQYLTTRPVGSCAKLSIETVSRFNF